MKIPSPISILVLCKSPVPLSQTPNHVACSYLPGECCQGAQEKQLLVKRTDRRAEEELLAQ